MKGRRTTSNVFMLGLIWMWLCTATASAHPSLGTVVLFKFPETASQTGNMDEIAALLSGDLEKERLTVQAESIPNLDNGSESLAKRLAAATPRGNVVAYAWIGGDNPNARKDETETKVSLSVYFPAVDVLIVRRLSSAGSAVASAPLASLLASMIRYERPRPTPATAQKAFRPSLPSTKVVLPPKPEEPSKLALETTATFVAYPETGTKMWGFSGDIGYFPFPPLLLHLGAAYLLPIHPDHPNYRLRFLEIPLWAGGRFVLIVERHEVAFNFAMLATITRFHFSDPQNEIPDHSFDRVNIGLTAGAGYAYYFLPFMGFTLNINGGFTPRAQTYQVANETLFKQPPFSLRFNAGLVFDFLR